MGKYSDEQQQQIDTYESSLKERKQAYIKAADAVSNYTIQSNRERAAKAAADEKAASDKQTAAAKAAAEKRKKDAEEAYRNKVEAIRAMEDESINLISNGYERETAKLRTEHRLHLYLCLRLMLRFHTSTLGLILLSRSYFSLPLVCFFDTCCCTSLVALHNSYSLSLRWLCFVSLSTFVVD